MDLVEREVQERDPDRPGEERHEDAEQDQAEAHVLPLDVGIEHLDHRVERCRDEEPALVQLGRAQVRCHFPLDVPS